MKRFIKTLFLIVLLVFPLNVFAVSKEYNDLVYKVVGEEVEKDKVNIYFFHRKGCPHCEKEIKFLNVIKDKYNNLNIYSYETSESSTNSYYLKSIKLLFNEGSNGVPYTVIGDKTFLGYNEFVGNQIEKAIQNYLNINDAKTETEKNTFNLPLIGEFNAKEASIPLIAIVIGLIDGFNPCAMWTLLFLINMLFGMKNKKKMFLIGYTFLLTSGLVYFLSMLGISVILDMTTIKWIQIFIALIAIIAGILNIRTYIKTRNDSGCHVIDDKKRKKVFNKINKIVNEKNLFFALIGVIMLAVSVNLVELACSLGFPAVFSEILALNNITGITRIIYLIIYVLFYMLDDIIVFTIATCTLSISTKSTKYTKYVNLIAGIIMILIGVLLIFKPEWVMLNF